MSKAQQLDLARMINKILMLKSVENCLVFESSKGQAFDLFVVFRNAEANNGDHDYVPISVYIFDLQSSQVGIRSGQKLSPSKVSCQQFERILTLIEALKELASFSLSEVNDMKNEFKLSNICQALINGHYYFNFFTTYAKAEVREVECAGHPNLVVSGAESAKQYFGILWPLVQASISIKSPSVWT